MSYVEKEKLIKADIASIENRVRHAFNQGYDLGFKDGQTKAKPQEQEPRWIPISKRLPEEYTYTLWCATSGEVRSDYFNGKYWLEAKRYCYEVIAWMPLPKPYKEIER